MKRIAHEKLQYKAYRYEVDGDFFNFRMQHLTADEDNRPLIELKVWDEPVAGGRYVIGFDPAYGRNDNKDHHAILVFRCYADRLVQVAEYVTADVETKHASWVLFHLCAAYVDTMTNVELGGPGRLVMAEFDHLRQLLAAEMNQAKTRERRWDDAASQARWYLYHKIDSPGAGYMANFETNYRTKQELMYSYRGAFASRELEIKSMYLLREMQNVVVIEDRIGAPESANEDNKDDRVFAAALANRAWAEWVRKDMIAAGETYEKVAERESGETPKITRNVNSLVARFLARADEEVEPERGPKWMVDQGLL
jgi:hypothetical protein